MKTIFTLVALLATSTVSACGSLVPAQSFPSVPLSQFKVSSWTVAKTTAVTGYTYDMTPCITTSIRIGSRVATQHFPSVKLSEFNTNSWAVAK